jgi:hypothetical protein
MVYSTRFARISVHCRPLCTFYPSSLVDSRLYPQKTMYQELTVPADGAVTGALITNLLRTGTGQLRVRPSAHVCTSLRR